RLRAVEELLVIVARKPESAALPVLEKRDQGVGGRAREIPVVGAEQRLHRLDQRGEHERVIVEIAGEIGRAVATRRVEAAIAMECRANRVDRFEREVGPARFAERPRGTREAGNRERVPRRQHLVVGGWAYPRFARLEQRGLGTAEPRLRTR